MYKFQCFSKIFGQTKLFAGLLYYLEKFAEPLRLSNRLRSHFLTDKVEKIEIKLNLI